MPRGLLLCLLAVLAAVAVAAPAGGSTVPPYGANDAGGVRNILPAGTQGTDNAAELAAFQGLGTRPAHWDDQLAPYVDLLYAPSRLSDAQLPGYFKDATFGVRTGDVASTTSPRPGVTIVRDARYGVPHVYGTTRGDVMFGAGYAGAQDRLFLMDVLRHTARAQLSSFVGGASSNRKMDQEQWQIAPYTEADLRLQIRREAELYGPAGTRVVADLYEYVAGINRYIAEARLDPNKLPSEYPLLGIPLRDWKVTDPVVTASLIGGIYGKGGGEELRSALMLQAARRRFGYPAGSKVWADFRGKDLPERFTTLRRTFPYETASPFSDRALALPDLGSVAFQSPVSAPATSAGRQTPRIGLVLPSRGASNALLVSARGSVDGHPLAVMGPEVGFYAPQILMEEDLHGPGIDADGAAFPGVNQYVQLGHGRDYAWSATSAYGDNVDTFAEPLCEPDGSTPTKWSDHYLYQDSCRAMETLTRTNRWTPNVNDATPAGSETLAVRRTVHGIVFARATVRGRPAAYVRARTNYLPEADSGVAFSALNDPARIRGPVDFQHAASQINFSFNWLYADSRHIAFFQSGAYPRRAPGTSPDFPVWGGGRFDWLGFSPDAHLANWIPYSAHPQAVDPPDLVNWNNQPAPGFAQADDSFDSGSGGRDRLLAGKVARSIAGGRRIHVSELVRIMEDTATQDVRGALLVPLLARAIGPLSDPKLSAAMTSLERWSARGAHRRDLDRDGRYDDDSAVTLMDAWWPELVAAEFQPSLGAPLYDEIQGLNELGNVMGGKGFPPEFAGGWIGYVQEDLSRVLGRRSGISFTRTYCGRGSLTRCRAALVQSLRSALGVGRRRLYGRDKACAADGRVEASCHDEERSTETAGIDVPPFPWAQRPTFQQVVDIPRSIR